MAYLSSGPKRKQFPIERRPQMLKDFLSDDSSSCSSNGFRSFPRQASCCTTVRNLVEMDLKARDSNRSVRLLRSRSKAASKTICAFQKASEVVINVVKHLPFPSMKAPSQSKTQTNQGIFPRSLSRRLKRSFWKKRDRVEIYDIKEIKVKLLIKDIIRWKSFRDLIEEKQQQQQPLDTTAATAAEDADTTTITTTSSISSSDRNSNSWCDSDFTSEYLQSSGGSPEYSVEKKGEEGKECSVEKKMSSDRGHNVVGEDSMETTTHSVDPKGERPYEEKEQFSPVSVLDFPEEEEEEDDEDNGETETSASFHQSLANMERSKQKLMQKIRRFECLAQLEPVDLEKRIALLEEDDGSDESPSDDGLPISEGEDQDEQGGVEVEVEANMAAEEKAMELLKLMKATDSLGSWTSGNLDGLLLDFFKESINQTKPRGRVAVAEVDQGFDYMDLVKVARESCGGMCLVGLEYNRETFVRVIENDAGSWRKFEEEQGELVEEVESRVLGSLVDELLVDLFC